MTARKFGSTVRARRVLKVVVALVAAVGALAVGQTGVSTAAQKLPPKSPLLIGVPLQLTGGSASSAAFAKGAIVAWEKWANDNGGINGHPVKLLIEDAGPDPVKALAVVKEMIDKKNVIAIVGAPESNSAAWMGYASKRNVAVVGVGVGNPNEYELANQFTLGYPFTNLGSFAAKLAAKEGIKKMGLVVCAEIASCRSVESAAKEAAQANGVEYGGTLTIAGSAPNYTAECLSIKSRDIGLVVLLHSSAPVVRFIGECERQGVKTTFFLSPGPLTKALQSLDATRIVTYLQSFPWWSTDPRVRAYLAAMKQYNPSADPKANFAVMNWTTFLFFQKAMAQLSDSPTRQEIIDRMYKVKNEDLGGLLPQKVTFTKGKPSTPFNCYFVAEVRHGIFVSPDGGLKNRCS